MTDRIFKVWLSAGFMAVAWCGMDIFLGPDPRGNVGFIFGAVCVASAFTFDNWGQE